MYSIKTDIYLDKYNDCYRKILVINKDPDDNTLKPYLKTIKKEKLSPFTYDNCCDNYQNNNCSVAIMNPYNKTEFLSLENIGDFFTVLIENGYKIDTKITSMLQKSTQKINNLICFISKIN
jgi:hypothetical protein